MNINVTAFSCAQDETRTHTVLRPLPPQSSVYTNFTTCALCPKQDSNLHVSQHSHLKRARLPIPPFGRFVSHIVLTADSFVFKDLFRKLKQELCPAHFYRAANETRTRDPNLGKVVLYQLSYCRRMLKNIALIRKRVQRYCFFLT